MATDDTQLVTYNEIETMTVGTLGAGTSLDAEGSKVFGDDVIGYITAHPGVRLLLNFQNITYLSSAALSELLRINDTAKAEKAAVQLCGLSKEIHKVFEITKLAEVFHIDPDEEVEKTIMRLNHDAEWEVFDG